MNETPKISFEKKELPPQGFKLASILIGLGLVLTVLGFAFDHTRMALNNVITFMFLASVGIGSLFLVSLEYIAGAVWSTPFRRVSEYFAFLIPICALLAIPMFFNLHDLFHWTHTEALETDPILKGKSPYLNVTFFVIRFLATFGIWTLFYVLLIRNSEKQDLSGDQSLTKKNITISAFFIPVFAITISLLAIDWIMSLEPHWFSSIFGVYYFSGTILAALSAGTIAIVLLVENGYYGKLLRRDHYYSLGALLFAFTNFWAYIAFSQYLLIWYANLPEETFWMLRRWEGGWEYLSIALIIFRFVIPYVGLLAQQSKMNPKRLLVMSVCILFAHYVDLYWLVFPSHFESFSLNWFEIGFPVLGVGLSIFLFYNRFKKVNLLPIGDPKLKRGLDFRL